MPREWVTLRNSIFLPFCSRAVAGANFGLFAGSRSPVCSRSMSIGAASTKGCFASLAEYLGILDQQSGKHLQGSLCLSHK